MDEGASEGGAGEDADTARDGGAREISNFIRCAGVHVKSLYRPNRSTRSLAPKMHQQFPELTEADRDLLRPVFNALCISPITLLMNRSLYSSSSSRVRALHVFQVRPFHSKDPLGRLHSCAH